jgi:hypothetical protein
MGGVLLNSRLKGKIHYLREVNAGDIPESEQAFANG